ncbi:MAG: glycosyltransferase [Chitinophagales bacterium]
MKDKILFLFTAEFPFGNGEPYIENEIDYLAATFKQVHIFTRNYGDGVMRNVPDNCEVHSMPKPSNKIDIRSLYASTLWDEIILNGRKNVNRVKVAIKSYSIALQYYRYIQEQVKLNEENISIVFYSYWLDDVAIALALIRKNSNRYFCVARAHGWDVYDYRHAFNYLPFRKFLNKKLSKIACISQNGSEYFAQKGVNNTAVFRLGTLQVSPPNFISNNSFFTIISIAALIPLKRIGLLIDALSILSTKSISFKWIHIGSGPLENDILRKAQQLNEKQYLFLGQKSNKEVKNILNERQDNSVLINVSETEGLPVTLMEAMSFGIPCIGTAVGGVSEIIENDINGKLIPSNPTALEVSSTIENYISLPQEIKIKWRKAAYQTWQNKFDANKNYDEFTRFIFESKS